MHSFHVSNPDPPVRSALKPAPALITEQGTIEELDADAQPSEEGTGSIFLRLGVAASIIALSVATMVSSFGLGYWVKLGPGPGFFPFWIGAVMTLSAFIWGFQALRKHQIERRVSERSANNQAEAAPENETPEPKRSIWIVVLSLLILAGLLEILGYQLAMFAFLILHLKVLGKRRWVSSLIIAAVGSVGIFILFTQVLQVPLPTSSIGFLQGLGV